jgi:hypothetical protein
MLDIYKVVHAQYFSALTTFALAGNPNKTIVGPSSNCELLTPLGLAFGTQDESSIST